MISIVTTILISLSFQRLTTIQTNAASSVILEGGGSFTRHSANVRKVVVVGGTHGNEYTGVWVIKSMKQQSNLLSSQYSSLEISSLLGNPLAHADNKRFVDVDLNRQFTLENLGEHHKEEYGQNEAIVSCEVHRAREINQLLGPKFLKQTSTINDRPNVDLAIDLHSTTTNMGLTLIIPEGDSLTAQAAAYVMQKYKKLVPSDAGNVRCLVHPQPHREQRFNLCSCAKHGITVEVGPVPQGVLRHDAVQRTEYALHAILDFFHNYNVDEGGTTMWYQLKEAYPTNSVPCYRSAPATKPGETTGRITWDKDPHGDNPNFPGCMVHSSLQDGDFRLLRKGDPLFVKSDGSVVNYDGSHGDEVYPIFVNEGGYYYASSGTGIGVAVQAKYDLQSGKFCQ
mmetsp:Transcript_8839/g.12571  ORF Transcript_8839/g.12571 Transcript_8839/m.12571 type:complete len:396 (-) Transcript_8839:196-1383(-)